MCQIFFYFYTMLFFHLLTIFVHCCRNVWNKSPGQPQSHQQGLRQRLLPHPKSSLAQFQARAPPLPRWCCPPRWAALSHSNKTRTSNSPLPPGSSRVRAHKVHQRANLSRSSFTSFFVRFTSSTLILKLLPQFPVLLLFFSV